MLVLFKNMGFENADNNSNFLALRKGIKWGITDHGVPCTSDHVSLSKVLSLNIKLDSLHTESKPIA